MGGVLRADLEALARLGTQIDALVGEMRSDIPTGAASQGASPALVVLQQLTTQTLPNVGHTYMGWMGAFGQVSDAFARGMIENEEHGIAVIRSIGNTSHNPTAHS
ncbi:hypothetical protein [Mycobacteroides sp. LB1]|uniref:hypothetical protein n=1 Tax=Mycobacteroides sp. LB1 TaxID=2750814 RepID=UPI0015DD672E|nr:hypothetical protein [Mycobacteroides sp. LB1]